MTTLRLWLILSTSVCALAVRSASGAPDDIPAPHAFTVGTFQGFVLFDRNADYAAASLFRDPPAEELKAALSAAGETVEPLPSPYEAVVVRTGQHVVLIDTGAGRTRDGTSGHLVDRLAAAGVRVDEIDTVLLTHAHLDHVGGVLDEHGQPRFPRAQHVLFRAEWDFWNQEKPDLSGAFIGDDMRRFFTDFAHQQLRPLQAKLRLLDGDTEVVPGVFAVSAPGHTPGHMVVRLESGKDRLLYVSDLVFRPLGVAHPDWNSRYECDPVLARQTRRHVLALAAREGIRVHAMHFVYPGLGYVETAGAGLQWRAEPR